jgi:hypothetical protein
MEAAAGRSSISVKRKTMPTTTYTLEHTKPVVFRLSTDDGQHLDSQQYLN